MPVACEVVESFWRFICAVYAWVDHWQTLVGAIIALVAALLTIAIMRRQIKQDADRHRDAQRRKCMAARAQMPDALSELSIYVRGCASWLVGNSQTLPTEPIAGITALKGVIEFVDDSAANRTFQVVSWYQVFRARMAGYTPDPERSEFGERIYDTALLQAYVNSLYDYARNEKNDVDSSDPTQEEMLEGLKNAFTLIHFMQERGIYQTAIDTIRRRHK